MLGSPAGPGGPSQRGGFWPLAPASAPTASTFAEGFSKYGFYSLFPGGPGLANTLFSHATPLGRFTSGTTLQASTGSSFHAAHKISDSIFSSGYTFGAPTPPPGSPYSPIPVAQLELLTKGFNSSNIIIQQPDFATTSPKKIQEKIFEEKCCSSKHSKTACNCYGSPIKSKFGEAASGCSRTNPIDWNTVNVKKEPGATPCQVAEVTTSISPVVKLEITSPTQKVGPEVHTTATIAANECQPVAGMAAASPGGVAGGGAFVQCSDDRSTTLAGWPVGGAHNPALSTPTVWQYPAHLPVEPLVPVPMSPLGLQLVRDPNSGHILLLPATGIEPVQQTVVWPSYPQPSSHVLLPPIPPPPLQLLSSTSSDYLSSSTTLHQHTQTQSTRLVAVTTDVKRKIPLPIPTTTLIKIEADTSTLDQTKTLQAVSSIATNAGTVLTDQNIAPLMTHVIYQHPATNLIVSQPPSGDTICRSQATSPVTLTPPPEVQSCPEEEDEEKGVQDASNQTESPICSEDDNPSAPEPAVQPKIKVLEQKHLQIPSHDITEAKPQIVEMPSETITPINNVSTQVSSEMQAVQRVVESPIKNSVPINEKVETTAQKVEVKVGLNVPKIAMNNLAESRVVEPTPKIIEPTPKIVELPMKVDEPKIVELPIELRAESPKLGKPEPIQKPDLSGLELLSNSIVEFENRQSSDKVSIKSEKVEPKKVQKLSPKPAAMEAEPIENPEKQILPKPLDDGFGGLDLLCALAEQRILEEVSEKQKKGDENVNLKRKSKDYQDEPKVKKPKSILRDSVHDNEKVCNINNNNHNEFDDIQKNYKKTGMYRDIRKEYIAKCKFFTEDHVFKDRDCNKLIEERDLDIERKEKCKRNLDFDEDRYLGKCDNDRDCHCQHEALKHCCGNEWNARELDMRKKLEILQRKYKEKQRALSKLKKKSHNEKEYSKVKSKSKKETPMLEKPEDTLVPNNTLEEPTKIPQFEQFENDQEEEKLKYPSVPSSPCSVKKRKVGRPKKFSSPAHQITTETIVSKKAKKSNFVQYILSAKDKVLQNPIFANSPPRYVEKSPKPRHKNHKHKRSSSRESKHKKNKSKAKKEKNKSYSEEEWVNNSVYSEEASEENLDEEVKNFEEAKPKSMDRRCVLTEEHLEVDKLRVLTAMGGLFYAGHLNAIEPPDVYSIVLDGERGNRPHIMSREDILRDAIVEVAPASTDDLSPGTRLCAYWSQQYRCLYPGSVAEPGTPDPNLDEKFVSVEFDDGDSGRIAIEDIRLLPPDYPIIEYDPNPLLSLSKRKRRTSTSVSIDERRQQNQSQVLMPKALDEDKQDDSNKDSSEMEAYRERKRLKKEKRQKLREKLSDEPKKKKRKHKCIDENCKHKKHHKKHRKHKRHHHRVEFSESPPQVHENEDNSFLEDYDEEQVSEENIEEDYDDFGNPENEVTIDDIVVSSKAKKSKKIRDRQESCESRSKMSAFLPARQLWGWCGVGYKRSKVKGRQRKMFYKAIQRGKETIVLGDSAVFLSTGRPDRPYIGRIEAMWEVSGSMAVRVKWFYHPEETVGCPLNLQYPGALFESPHADENDVQTISHKCEVLPLDKYVEKLGDDPQRYATIYDNNDIYYLAGYYDPTSTTLKIEPDIPFTEETD